MKSSPDRGKFQVNIQMKQVSEGKKSMEEVQQYIELAKAWRQEVLDLEETDEWKIDNLEYDLRSTEWICNKVKENDNFAQNLYAAMCNNDFTRNEVWPILQDKRWSCSWRHAGGIIADMQEKGDYIDWYCSGIRGEISDEEYHQLTKEEQEKYINLKNNYVGEGYVTDEVREDLLKLGWIVVDTDIDE